VGRWRRSGGREAASGPGKIGPKSDENGKQTAPEPLVFSVFAFDQQLNLFCRPVAGLTKPAESTRATAGILTHVFPGNEGHETG